MPASAISKFGYPDVSMPLMEQPQLLQGCKDGTLLRLSLTRRFVAWMAEIYDGQKCPIRFPVYPRGKDWRLSWSSSASLASAL